MMVEKHHGGKKMEKKTIGQFIAVLRKANGMTQQELADRLNVSNKAVSRWERDESAPDITLIPALAEILGVTCDELLKGERITYSEQVEKKEVKVEKQVKSLIQRELSKYRTMMWISLALVGVGFVLPFALIQSFYFTDAICLAAMFLFELIAFVIVTIAVAQMKDIKEDCELFENAEISLVKKYDKCMGETSYLVYYLIAAIFLSMLLLYSHMIPGTIGLVCLMITLIAGYWLLKEKYVTWITGNKKECKPIQEEMAHVESVKKMNRIQIATILLYGLLFFFSPYFKPSPTDMIVDFITLAIAICLLLVNVISPIVFILKEKENRRKFIHYGLRNILLLPSAFLFSQIHTMSWDYDSGVYYDCWYWEYLICVIAWGLGVVAVFALVERKMRQK